MDDIEWVLGQGILVPLSYELRTFGTSIAGHVKLLEKWGADEAGFLIAKISDEDFEYAQSAIRTADDKLLEFIDDSSTDERIAGLSLEAPPSPLYPLMITVLNQLIAALGSIKTDMALLRDYRTEGALPSEGITVLNRLNDQAAVLPSIWEHIVTESRRYKENRGG